MIKVLIVASIIFGVVFSFGLTSDKLPIGQMASGLENISNDLVSGLEILGLSDEEQDVDADVIIGAASVDFEVGMITVDDDNTPNSGDEHFINIVSSCTFHSEQSIDSPTCVICTLTNSTGHSVGSGRVELPDGYQSSITIPVPIDTVEFEGQNSVFSVDGVILDVCDAGEGCSVTFWQGNEFAWDAIPVPQDTSFRLAFFGPNDAETFEIMLINGTTVSHPTFLDALNADTTKDGLHRLVPQAVAALLNSQSTIDFNLTSDEIVISFNGAFSTPGDDTDDAALADIFLSYNDMGCPLLNNGALP